MIHASCENIAEWKQLRDNSDEAEESKDANNLFDKNEIVKKRKFLFFSFFYVLKFLAKIIYRTEWGYIFLVIGLGLFDPLKENELGPSKFTQGKPNNGKHFCYFFYFSGH